MIRSRFSLYTGPVTVKETAEILRSSGFTDVIEGTEHVHATIVHNTTVRQLVDKAIGYETGYSDIQVYYQADVNHKETNEP